LSAGVSMSQLEEMSAATLMQQIRILPETEKEALLDALWREDREALLDRLEEEQDLQEARAVLNDPNTEWVPWDEVKRSLDGK
jgi:hypothetical protein